MIKTKLSSIVAAFVVTSSLSAGEVPFSKIEKQITEHTVYKNIKSIGFTPSKTFEDANGMFTVTGVIPGRKLPNGKVSKAQNIVTFITSNGKYMIFGDVLKADGQKLEVPIEPVDISILKGKEAFKMGTGPKEVFVFSDPDCPGCIGFFKSIICNRYNKM